MTEKNSSRRVYLISLGERLFGMGIGMIFASSILMYFDYSQNARANISLVALVPVVVGLILTVKYGKKR